MVSPLGTSNSPSPAVAFDSVIFTDKQCCLAIYLTYYLYQDSKGKLTEGQVCMQKEKGSADTVFTPLCISNFTAVSLVKTKGYNF